VLNYDKNSFSRLEQTIDTYELFKFDGTYAVGGTSKTYYGDLSLNGLYLTMEISNSDDVLQTINIKGLGGNGNIDSGTNIMVNDISANIRKLHIFGKIKNPQNTDLQGNVIYKKDHRTEMYSNYKWEYITDLSYNVEEFYNGGYVKRWIKNKYNSQHISDKNYKYYRFVISENFGAPYIYIKHIKLGKAQNIIDKREKAHTLTDMSYNIITKNTMVETGFFNYKPNIREIALSDENKYDENKYGAFNDISLNNTS